MAIDRTSKLRLRSVARASPTSRWKSAGRITLASVDRSRALHHPHRTDGQRHDHVAINAPITDVPGPTPVISRLHMYRPQSASAGMCMRAERHDIAPSLDRRSLSSAAISTPSGIVNEATVYAAIATVLRPSPAAPIAPRAEPSISCLQLRDAPQDPESGARPTSTSAARADQPEAGFRLCRHHLTSGPNT